jgi:hypothetical protein
LNSFIQRIQFFLTFLRQLLRFLLTSFYPFQCVIDIFILTKGSSGERSI